MSVFEQHPDEDKSYENNSRYNGTLRVIAEIYSIEDEFVQIIPHLLLRENF